MADGEADIGAASGGGVDVAAPDADAARSGVSGAVEEEKAPDTERVGGAVGTDGTEEATGAALWTKVCEDFFFRGDHAAKLIIDVFLTSNTPDDGPADVAVAMDESPVEHTEEQRMLTRLGFRISPDGTPTLDKAMRQQFEDIKNQVRSGFHAERGRLKRQEFAHLVNLLHSVVHDGLREGDIQPLAHNAGEPEVAAFYREVIRTMHEAGTIDGRVATLRRFIANYKSRAGCQPFLKGLYMLLSRQLEEDNVAEWTLPDVTFTDSAGEDFCRSALELMIITLRCTPDIVPPVPMLSAVRMLDDAAVAATDLSEPRAASAAVAAAGEADEPTNRSWRLPVDLSDARARKLRRALPGESVFPGGGPGRIGVAEVHRMNRDGAGDPADERGVLSWCTLL